jgi:hypothetical protein
VAGVKPGNIPIDEIGPFIGALIDQRWPWKEHESSDEFTNGYLILAEKVGCDQSSIWKIVEGRNPGATFDLIDAILCALGRPDVLDYGIFSHLVDAVEFREKCKAPGCSRVFEEHMRGGVVKRHCSRRCCATTSNIRRGLGSGTTRMGRCHRGHKLSDDNVVSQNGRRACRTCKRAAQRKWKAKRRQEVAA